MLPNGKYRTRHGSTMGISGKHGGVVEVVFDWAEEDACCDCKVAPENSNGYLVWHCEVCGGGKAELFPS